MPANEATLFLPEALRLVPGDGILVTAGSVMRSVMTGSLVTGRGPVTSVRIGVTFMSGVLGIGWHDRKSDHFHITKNLAAFM